MSLIGWKNMFVLWDIFNFSRGIEILLFCSVDGIYEHKFTPMLFQEWYENLLVQIECSGCWKIILSCFWCSKFALLLLRRSVKQRKTEKWALYPVIGPSHPISEIGTSHIYRLKKTRNEGGWSKIVFLIKRVRAQCYIFWVSCGWGTRS